jgi:hypothetical protein
MLTSLINPGTHRDMIHIRVFIWMTVEFYSGVVFTAGNSGKSPDKVQGYRLQGGWLFVNGESDERGRFSTASSGVSLRRK